MATLAEWNRVLEDVSVSWTQGRLFVIRGDKVVEDIKGGYTGRF